MAISEHDLVDQFGTYVEAGNGALFIGAGLSMSAGYPSWDDLVSVLRREGKIPKRIDDLPLVAQYYAAACGRDRLLSHLLERMSKVACEPTPGHEAIARLPISDIWTSNYDRLVETAAGIPTIVSDEDFSNRSLTRPKRLVKMHGSLNDEDSGWRSKPVISREDYEQYANNYPRIWATLQSTFLTKSMLFLGFSFNDPNIGVLLQLSRSLPESPNGPEHFAVMKRPTEGVQRTIFDLQVNDLDQSGVAVHPIDDFEELDAILLSLVRRTRPPTLFVSGSWEEGQNERFAPLVDRLGELLAETQVNLASLAGPAGTHLSFAFGETLIAKRRYDPSRVSFYFRKSAEPAPPHQKRIGTIVHTQFEREVLISERISECRALLAVGGSDRTMDEIAIALDQGIPVIPLAAGVEGCAADKIWNECSEHLSGDGEDDRNRDWQLLADPSVDLAAYAALRLVQRAMYLA